MILISLFLPPSSIPPYSINNPRTSTNLYYYHHFYSCSFSSLFSSLSALHCTALHAHGKSCRFINVNILSFHGPTTFYVYFIIIVLSMFSNCRGHSFFFYFIYNRSKPDLLCFLAFGFWLFFLFV